MNIDTTPVADLAETSTRIAAARSGRASWDERGNGIWEWQTAPGVYSREISSQQLQALQACELSLQESAAHGEELTLWSRNARITAKRSATPAKYSGFEHFLKRLGLPA